MPSQVQTTATTASIPTAAPANMNYRTSDNPVTYSVVPHPPTPRD